MPQAEKDLFIYHYLAIVESLRLILMIATYSTNMIGTIHIYIIVHMVEMMTLHTGIYECPTSLNPNRSSHRVKDNMVGLKLH